MELLFRWYHDHAGRLLLLHIDAGRRFPLDTFLCDNSVALSDAQRSAAFLAMFGEIHVPLLLWPDGSTYEINTDVRTTNVLMFNRCVVDLLDKVWRRGNATWACPVYGGCNLQMKDADDCLNRPWKKGWGHPTCPYGAAARVFGIDQDKSFNLEPFAATHPPAPVESPKRRLGWLATTLLVVVGVAAAWGIFRLLRHNR